MGESPKRKSKRYSLHMLVVTFHTTADAFAFEAAMNAEGAPGRLGTIPRSLTAGCGFAWLADDADRPAIERVISERDLSHDALCET